MRKQVPMPANETAWLRDNARLGAVILTLNGERNAYLGERIAYGDPDKPTSLVYPLFPSREQGGKRYTDTSRKPMLD